MKQFIANLMFGTLFAMVGAAIAAGAAADPVIGTWKLDVAKSMFAASAAFKAQTRTYSQSAQGITLNVKTVGTDGKETTVLTTYQLDGKTLTATAKNAKGEDTLIFNKQ